MCKQGRYPPFFLNCLRILDTINSMERRSKELIALFIILSIFATAITYWRYVVKHDYVVFYDKDLLDKSIQDESE